MEKVDATVSREREKGELRSITILYEKSTLAVQWLRLAVKNFLGFLRYYNEISHGALEERIYI